MAAPSWAGGRGRRVDALLDLWVLLPVVVLTWPLLTRAGYPFSRDLVLTPALPLRPETLGLGTAAPRAVPLDAVVGALSAVIDGGVVGRVGVVGALAVAGWGAHRLARTLAPPARALVGALAVWNPFVVERLGLGQWALLLGYAALWWVVLALRSRERPLARAAPWLVLGALTPTGAVLVGATALVAGASVRPHRRRHALGLLCLVAAVQLPWLLPALSGAAGAASDPGGVAAFAARAEGRGPAYVSLVGLGGIWDAFSVPGSREGWLGTLTAVVVAASVVTALRTGRVVGRRLATWGAASLVLSGLTTVPLGATLVASGSDVVPGLGLLRDGQKWLAPFVVVAVLSVGVASDLVLRGARRRAPVLTPSAVVVALVVPFLLLPDATVVVHRVLTPARYPADYRAVSAAVDGTEGVLVTAPWRLYRRYPWATEYPTYDPASRWFDVRVVTSDDLGVGESTVGGEDPYAARIGALLASPGPGTAGDLATAGVRWVLVTRTDPDAGGVLDALGPGSGVRRVVDGADLVLLELADDSAAVPEVTTWRRVLVVGTDLTVLALLVVVSLSRARRRGP